MEKALLTVDDMRENPAFVEGIFAAYKNNLESIIEERVEKQLRVRDNMLDAITSMIEYRSMESGKHVQRIKLYTKAMLQYMLTNFSETYKLTPQRVEIISKASALHDIGKINIPDNILLKPGRLDAVEFDIMKTHTTLGSEMIETMLGIDDSDYIVTCIEIARSHHERADGRGYPDGLHGDEIPLSARVVSIADVYDALRSPRIYKPPYTHEKAVQMIVNGECGKFADDLTDCFVKLSSKFEHISEENAD